VWRRAGNARASEAALTAAIAVEPDNVDARLSLGKLRLLMGDAPRALALYRDAEAAYRRHPYLAQEKLVEVKVGMGRALVAPGPERAPDKARQALEEAIGLDPEDPEAQFQLGRVLVESGELARGRDALARATELDPEYADAHFFLAEAWKPSDAGRARKSFTRYLELAPRGEHAKAAKKALEGS
jgi:cytochrome c-type biogenesis protein CcmH/NrfG